MAVVDIKVPSPGESITQVEVAQWLVEDGEYVEKDQIVCEIDSDKATLEFPAEAAVGQCTQWPPRFATARPRAEL